MKAEGHYKTYKGGKEITQKEIKTLYNVLKNKGKEVHNIPAKNGNLVHSQMNC